MLFIHNAELERLIGNYQNRSPWRQDAAVINGVRSPTGITKVWNVYDETAIVITTDKTVETTRTTTTISQRTTSKTFLIVEELRQGNSHTIAGLLLEIKGDFLKQHEKIDYQNFTFEILEIEGRRISKVKVVMHDYQPTEDHPTA